VSDVIKWFQFDSTLSQKHCVTLPKGHTVLAHGASAAFGTV
jgi:hypothetical protein